MRRQLEVKNLARVLWVLVAAAGLSPWSPVEAGPPAAAGEDISAHTAVVPFDPGRDLADQRPDQVFLDYPTFLRLWEAAKSTRRERGRAGRDDGLVAGDAGGEGRVEFSQALYRVEMRDDGVGVEAELEVLLAGAEWFKVPLGFGDIPLSVVTVDGAPAATTERSVLVRGAGRHTVGVGFDLPAEPGWDAVAWDVPPAAATMVAVEVDDASTQVAFPGVRAVSESGGPAGRVVTAALGPAARVTIGRESMGTARVESRIAVADAVALGNAGAALERFEWTVRLDLAGSPTDAFSFDIAGGVLLVSLHVPGARHWRMEEAAADTTRVAVALGQPVSDTLTFAVTAERVWDKVDDTRAFPALTVDGARRTQTTAVLAAAGEVALDPQPAPGTQRTDAPEGATPPEGATMAGAYRWAGGEAGLSYSVRAVEPERSATLRYVYQVSENKLETVIVAALESAAALPEVVFPLAGGMAVEAVTGTGVADWWTADGRLTVRFGAGETGTSHVLISLLETLDALPDRLALARMTPEGFADVSGEAVVVAHKKVAVTLDLEGGSPSSRAREVALADAAHDVEVLPPMETKRAFVFAADGYEAAVTFSTIDPRFETRWVMRAVAHDAWVDVSAVVDVEAERSALSEVEFTLPADVPVATVEGDEVRETTSTAEGDLRRYTVTFQREIFGATRFTVTFELPHQGSLVLPALTVAGAARAERFVVVENRADGELKVGAENANVVARELFPFLPAGMGRADLFQVADGYRIALALEALETTAGADVLVSLLELTTALRRNGDVWHRAVYRMQNRSLQFLPVRLPDGAELVSAVVAGEPVRADRGQREGRPALLVPLIQTKPGQLAYDVELVYRASAGGGGERRESLDVVLVSPKMVGLTAERTLWALYLPDGFGLDGHDGNLRPVEETENAVERLKTVLAEVDDLNSLMRSSNISSDVKREALDNSAALTQQLEEEFGSVRAKAQRWDKEAAAPSAKGELEMLGKKLEEQKIVLSQNRVALPEPAQEAQAMSSLARDRTTGVAGVVTADAEAATATSPATPGRQSQTRWFFNSSELRLREENRFRDNAARAERIKNQVGLNDNLFIGGKAVEELALPDRDGAAEKPSAPSDEADTAKSKADAAQLSRRARAAQPGNEPRQQGADPNNAPAEPSPQQEQQLGLDGWRGVAGADSLSRFAPAPAIPQAFRAAGRVSLDVDFPVSGDPYHFQKLKDGARLEIKASEKTEPHRLAAWGLLIAAAFVLALVEGARRGRTRRARTAA